jgi:broad specificity phosphatase PhoE
VRTLLIRHSETVWNAASKIQGQADPALSDRGEEQCRRLRDRLRGAAISRIYTSDLGRARLTAEAIAAGRPGPDPVPTEGLREVSLGEWEGATAESLASEWPEQYQEWLKRPSWDLVPGGEGEKRFEARVRGTMSDILAASGATGVIAVVTHIGVIRLLLSILTGAATEDMRWRWAIDNTSITAVDSEPDFSGWTTGQAEIVAVNDNVHLRGLRR